MPTSRHTELGVQGNEFTLTRVFDAPPELVWRAWTDPAMLGRWFGPHGFTCPVCQVSLHVGGRWRIVMRSPDGREYPLKGSYLEVVPGARLVMSVELDEHPPDWHAMLDGFRPEQGRAVGLRFIVTVAEEGAGTRLTVVNRFDRDADRDAFIRMNSYDGWSQSFERLDLILAERSRS